ncbi:unnamed protein product [Orchesella dallaii]|uniref:WAP domain-containing protein n=1 Tax=Orchesella dallaii TaxID=48710 RepID=A0ABP1R337_9HEXA
MKAIFIVAAVLLCTVSAQKAPRGCPSNKATFGICTFDPNVNCLQDSQCQGGQLCCPDGCNRICKDPEPETAGESHPPPASLEVIHCPPATGGSFGICSFDENVNCLGDEQCKNGQMCCADGCNKVCKEPVRFQPIKPQPKPAFVKQ